MVTLQLHHFSVFLQFDSTESSHILHFKDHFGGEEGWELGMLSVKTTKTNDFVRVLVLFIFYFLFSNKPGRNQTKIKTFLLQRERPQLFVLC